MNRIDHQTFARRHQRGSAALVVTLILFIVATLIAAFANRNLVFEQRASANQYRSTQAFEAAEAGLEWATAMLNNPRPINDRCAEGDGASVNFRERYLTADPGGGALQPVTRSDAGHVTALRAVCVKTGTALARAMPRRPCPMQARRRLLRSPCNLSPTRKQAQCASSRPAAPVSQASACPATANLPTRPRTFK